MKIKGWIDFFIRGEHIDRVENALQTIYISVMKGAGQNYFFYCQKCGEVWGKIIFQYGTGWKASCHLCREHGGSESLIRGYDALEDIDDMPEGLMTYEFIGINKQGSDLWRPS